MAWSRACRRRGTSRGRSAERAPGAVGLPAPARRRRSSEVVEVWTVFDELFTSHLVDRRTVRCVLALTPVSEHGHDTSAFFAAPYPLPSDAPAPFPFGGLPLAFSAEATAPAIPTVRVTGLERRDDELIVRLVGRDLAPRTDDLFALGSIPSGEVPGQFADPNGPVVSHELAEVRVGGGGRFDVERALPLTPHQATGSTPSLGEQVRVLLAAHRRILPRSRSSETALTAIRATGRVGDRRPPGVRSVDRALRDGGGVDGGPPRGSG